MPKLKFAIFQEAIQTHQKAIYRLISSHADLEVQLFLATALKGDFFNCEKINGKFQTTT